MKPLAAGDLALEPLEARHAEEMFAVLQEPELTVTGNVAWIAYVIGSRHWGRGHATESMRAVMKHLASDYGARLFRASVEADNARSIRLLERLGFKLESQEGTEQLYARSLGTMPP